MTPDGIKKYDNAEEIIVDYFKYRLKHYKLRKNNLLKQYKFQAEVAKNKANFVQMVVNETLRVFKVARAELERNIEGHGFKKVNNSYDYLLNIKTYQYTAECIAELNKDKAEKESLHDELNASGASLILTALTEKYAEMIHSDLEKLDDETIARMRVFGAGIAKHLPEKFAPTVMPYDRRLDGPQSPCPGTMSDFGQRALRHFAGLLHSGQVLGADLDADRSELERHMAGWLPRKTPVRTKLSDDEVINFIQASWEVTEGRSQATLRLLRDSGRACEQGRFRDLFHKARAQRQSQEASLL
jgi:hypothetical protein